MLVVVFAGVSSVWQAAFKLLETEGSEQKTGVRSWCDTFLETTNRNFSVLGE